jgi:hypothetical protein
VVSHHTWSADLPPILSSIGLPSRGRTIDSMRLNSAPDFTYVRSSLYSIESPKNEVGIRRPLPPNAIWAASADEAATVPDARGLEVPEAAAEAEPASTAQATHAAAAAAIAALRPESIAALRPE